MPRWTPAHKRLVERAYDPHWFGVLDLANETGHTYFATEAFIKEHKLHKRKNKRWTLDENNLLLRISSHRGYKQKLDLFPGRTWSAIRMQLSRLRKHAKPAPKSPRRSEPHLHRPGPSR